MSFAQLVGGCTVAVNGNNVFTNDFCASSRPNLFRISGFNFTGSVGTAAIWMYCNQDLQQVRIDHNDFSIAVSQIAVLFGETQLQVECLASWITTTAMERTTSCA